jgi:hypothetical protein
MISQSSEKHSAAQQGNLKSTDIDIDAMSVPGPRTDSVGNNGGEGAVEVKEEEDGETSAEEEKDEELAVRIAYSQSIASCGGFWWVEAYTLKPGCLLSLVTSSTSSTSDSACSIVDMMSGLAQGAILAAQAPDGPVSCPHRSACPRDH